MNAFAETGKCRRKNQMPVLAQEVGNRRQHQPPAQAPWTRTKVRGDFISRIKTKTKVLRASASGCNLSPRSYRKNDSFSKTQKNRSLFHIRVQDRSQMFGQ